MIRCTKCNEEKEYSLFAKRKDTVNGYSKVCKKCANERAKIYRENDPERYKKDSRDSYYRNRETRLIYDRNRTEKKKEYWKAWKENNNEKYREGLKKQRLRIDRKLRANLCRRINHALFNNIKSLKTCEYIGFTVEGLKAYIEKQFIGIMEWKNYGSVWEIDHIIPCTLFNLADDEEAKKCFNYKNLRPLYISENRKKSSIFSIEDAYRFGIEYLLPYNYNVNRKEG